MQPSALILLRSRAVIIAVLLGASWISLVLSVLSLLILVALCFAIFLMIQWKSSWPLLVILLSPLSVFFGCGITEWFDDRPRFKGKGLPSPEFFNLDPETRCYRSTGGCVVYGNEWAYQTPHNTGLSLMTTLFGPPGKTYKGPYPTAEEAVKLTASAEETSTDLFLKDTVLVSQKEVHLREGTSELLLSDFSLAYFSADSDNESRRVRAVNLDEQCLIVRVSYKDQLSDETDGIVLFDIAKMEPFARYVVTGRVHRISRMLAR